MIRVHKIRLLIVVSMILMLASMVTPALADCTSTPNGSGANFTCTDITTVVTGTSGSDNITNNGTILTYMWGGGFSPNQSQQDVLTNNGVVGSAEDDDGIWGGAGNDTIINNGVVNGGPWTVWNGVNGAIFGDDTLGVTDDDTIIINSVVHGNIHGDFSAGGDDTITINGRVNGGVYGEGHESVQFGRYGNDTVILTNNAIVTTIIDGMGGNDRLRFDFEVPDEATYIALSNQIANANPASGSLTFNGNTFTWVNFEILENSVEWTGAPPNQPPTAAIAAPTAGQVFTADGSGSASVTLNAAGSSDSDGTITGYAWSWTGTSSGAATGNPANRSFGVGSYTLTLTVTDDDGATDTETRSFTVQPPAGQVTLTLQPTASANDVNEDGSSFSTGSALWIGNGSSATNSWLGVRFTGVNIPAGATIQSAYLEVYATSTQWTRVNVNIRGEAVDNSPLFTTTTRPSQRSLTSASTTYNVDEQWTSNSWRNLGSVLPIIQEIVGRPNWQSGNSLSLLLKGMGNAWGRKSIGSFDANPAFAPRLVITYIAGEPVNQPPTAVIAAPTEGQVFTADGSGNASVTLNAAGSSDSDGTIASYAWSWTGTASGNATGSSATRSFGVGSYSLTLTVTDDDGATDTETRSFTVQAAPPPNQPPTAVIASPTEGQVFTADSSGNASVTLNAAGSSDSDGTIASYAWSWTGTASGNATGSSANRSFGVGSYSLTLTVTDDDGATDTETRAFSVQAAPNQPPTAVIASPTEGQVFTADGSGNASVTLNAAGSSDSDGTITGYAWSWTGTASGSASGGATAQSFGVGSYSLTLTVTDDDGATDTETRSFTVQAAPNQPPTAVIASPTEGQVFTADGSGNASVTLNAAGSSDSDGTIASYAWSWTGTASGNATGSSANRSFGVGSYSLMLTVTDDDGATDTETRSFTVQAAPPPNQPPTAVIASPTEGQVFTADGSGNASVTLNAAGSGDSDGTIASYAWSWTGTASGNATGSSANRSFGVGSYSLMLTVTDDDGATDTETRSFTVQAAPPPNQPPTAVIAAPTEGQMFTADGSGNASVTLNAAGSSDSDGTITSYAWSWTGTASGNATGSSATRSFGVGSYSLTLTVTDDDGATDTETRAFSVQAAPNQPPTAVIAAPTEGQVFTADSSGNASVTLNAAGSSDSDGTIASYAWSWTGTASGSASGGATAQSFGVGSYTVTLTVTDDDGATDTETRAFSVQAAPNLPPTISPIPAQSTRQGVTITPLTISASDPNNDPLTISVTNLPDGLDFDSTTRQVTGTVAANATTRTVTVSASDSVNPPATLNFLWTIVDDLPPTFSPANQTHTVGAVVNLSLNNFASDPEGLALRFELTGGSLPPGLTLQTTGEVTGTISGSPAVYTPTIAVIDSVGQSVTASFTWTVQAAPSGPVTLTLQPTASTDDVNEDGSSLSTSGSLWVGNASSASNSWLGVRFTGVNIPQGATITSAQLEVFAISNQWILLNMNIAGEAVDNSATFSTSNRPSQRALTTAQVTYNTNQQWNQYNWYNLGNVAAIVQEIVNRPNWQSGNSLSLLLKGMASAWSRKSIASWDNNPIYAPRLTIEYTLDGMSMTGVAEMILPEPTAAPTTNEVTPVVPAPVAAFTSTALTGEASLSVQFSNTSTGGDSYHWDFGDGTSSTETNPVKAYSAAGSYTVVLTVTNAGGTSSAQATVVVTAPPEPEMAVQPPPEEVQPPALQPADEDTPLVEVTPEQPPTEPEAEQTPEA